MPSAGVKPVGCPAFAGRAALAGGVTFVGGTAPAGVDVIAEGAFVAPSPRSSGPWVGSVMDRPQPLDGDVGIELRGGERSVTEQFLDAP